MSKNACLDVAALKQAGADDKEVMEAMLYLDEHPEVQKFIIDSVRMLAKNKPAAPLEHILHSLATTLHRNIQLPPVGVPHTPHKGLTPAPSNPNFQAAIPTSPPPSAPPALVVSGPSGVGKGTLLRRALEEIANLSLSVSHTTRKPRPGEVDGVHYHFTEKEALLKDAKEGKFLETAEVHGNYYGTSLAAVEKVRKEGKIVMVEIDVQGVRQVKKSPLGPNAHYIFIRPSSLEELEKRLRGRGTESEDKVQLRLKNAHTEMEAADEIGFDCYLVNDDLETSYQRLLQTLHTWYPGLVPCPALPVVKPCSSGWAAC